MDPLSIIASVIGIIGGMKTTYTTIKTIAGLPKAFDKVRDDFLFVQKILRDIQNRLIDGQQLSDEDSKATIAIVSPCRDKAQELKRIFDAVEAEYKKDQDAKDWEKIRVTYHKALRGIKTHRVESLMKDILEDLQKLALSRSFMPTMQKDLKAIQNAIEELSKVEPSLADSEFESSGTIHASQNVAEGATAQQNNVQGGVNTFVSGEKNVAGNHNTINFAPPIIANRRLMELLQTNPHEYKTRIEPKCHHDRPLDPALSEWIFNDPNFKAWRDRTGSQLLWINGEAGKGKTMLLASIINKMLPTKKQSDKSSCQPVVVSYFFCAYNDETVNKATAVLRGLIYFLVEHMNDGKVLELQERLEHVNARPILALSIILADLVGMLREIEKTVYLIIDALDECNKAELEELLGQILRIASQHDNVRWLVSSREDSVIRSKLGSKGTRQFQLDLNNKNIASAIDTYIDNTLSNIKLLRHKIPLRVQVRDKIYKKSNANFLWASCACSRVSLHCEVKGADENFEKSLLQMLEGAPPQPHHMETIKMLELGNQKHDLFKEEGSKHYYQLDKAIPWYEEAIVAACRTNPDYRTGIITACICLAECHSEFFHKDSLLHSEKSDKVRTAMKYVNKAQDFLAEQKPQDKALLRRATLENATLDAQMVLIDKELLEAGAAAATLRARCKEAKNQLSTLKKGYKKDGDQKSARWADYWLNQLDMAKKEL